MFPLAVAVLLLNPEDLAAKPLPPEVRFSAVSVEEARQLIERLGSRSYREREEAAVKLKQLGRHAIPAMKQAAEKHENTEIRLRCEEWLPDLLAEDFEVRLVAFLADTENRYRHDVPGWREFQTATKNHPLAREAYANLLRDNEQRQLLSGIGLPRGEFQQRLINRKFDLYNQIYRAIAVAAPDGSRQRYEPSLNDVIGLLFAEIVAGDHASQGVGVRAATPYTLMLRANIRTVVKTDKYGPLIKELTLNWMESRSQPASISSALQMAKIVEVSPLPFAYKLLDFKGSNANTLAQAICTIGEAGKAEDLPKIAKLLNREDQVYPSINGMSAIQLRDVALAMTLHLMDKKPEDYGMQSRYPNNDVMRFYYYSYSFPKDEDREAALTKLTKEFPKIVIKKD